MPVSLDDHLATDGIYNQRLALQRLNLIGEDSLHVLNAIERMGVAEKTLMTDDPSMVGANRTAIHVPTVDK